MAGTLSPVVFTVLDNSGLIVSGAKIFTYRTGTSTKQNTYTTALLSVASSNPIVADSAGRAIFFLDPSTGFNYDIVVCLANSADPPTSPLYTLSNIAAGDSSGTGGDLAVVAGENITAGDWAYLSLGDGSKTAGKWYKTDADFTYASRDATNLGVATADIAADATGTIRTSGLYTAASGLTAGTTYYLSATSGALTATEPANGRAVCTAYSTTAYSISMWQRPVVPVLNSSDRQVTGGETFGPGNVVYLSAGDGARTAGRWYLADADLVYASVFAEVGVAVSSFTAGSLGYVRTIGIYQEAPLGLSAGLPVYISATAGLMTQLVGGTSYLRQIGVAISTTALLICPDPFFGTKALQGIGSGFGSVGNSMVRTVMDTSVAHGINGTNTLHTTTLLGSTIRRTGDTVRYLAKGFFAANNTNKTLALVYTGSGGVGTMTVVNAVGAATNDAQWSAELWIVSTGLNTQNLWAEVSYGAVGAAAVKNILAVATTACDTENAAFISVSATGGAVDDVVQNFSTLRVE